MESSDITLRVFRSGDVVEAITWRADEGTGPDEQAAKAFILALWDAKERSALRIDLWTRDMTVDDMNDSFLQTPITRADTYATATPFAPRAGAIKVFAQGCAEKAARATRRSLGQAGGARRRAERLAGPAGDRRRSPAGPARTR